MPENYQQARSKNSRLKTPPTQEVQDLQKDFAKRLSVQMQLKGLSQSDLAAKIWGRTKDKRGYEVARNRDRVSAYLAGAGMPEPDNLRKLATALGCKIEDLVGADGLPAPVSRRASSHIEVHLAMVAEHPGMMQVQLNMLLPSAAAMEIVGIADRYRRETQGANGGSDDQ